MAKLKDRRTAHRFVAEVLWAYTRKKKAPADIRDPLVRAEVERIREAHFAAGAIVDDLPDDFDVPEIGPGMGGEKRCQGCGKELAERVRLCPECQAKAEPENDKVLA